MRILKDFFCSIRARGQADGAQHALARPAPPTAAAPAASPSSDQQLYSQARAFHQQGQLNEAETLYRALLKKYPTDFDLLHFLGVAQGQRNNFATAVEFIEQAIAINPGSASAYSSLGNCLKGLGKHDDALASYDKALALQPDSADIWNNRGATLHDLKRSAEGLESYERALAIMPDHVQALDNRGTALRELRRPGEALASHDKALTIDPGYASAHFNRGLVLRDLERPQEAVEAYAHAIKSNPDHVEAHWNLSIACLQLGDFARGWDEFEWRWQAEKNRDSKLTFRAPVWDGQKLHGSLLVWNEHGVGDEIFYAGMLNDLEPYAGSITVCVDQRLVPLFQRSFCNMQVISRQMLTPDARFDAHIPMGSLGRYLRHDASAFPKRATPYLHASATHARKLRAAIGSEKTLLCGLSWLSKNPESGMDKSLQLLDLEPVLALPGIDFVDLQYGDTSQEQTALYNTKGLRLKRVTEIDNFRDIDGLAALIDACDVIVTVSNTTAHLAAALGKPVLLMLPFSRGLLWYWHMERTDNPWYPTVKTFRQRAYGEWQSVIDRVCQELTQQGKASCGAALSVEAGASNPQGT